MSEPWLAYGLSLAPSLRPILGLDGSPITWWSAGALCIPVSGSSSPKLNPVTPESAWMYQSITKQIHSDVDMIPLRFPTWVEEKYLKAVLVKNESVLKKAILSFGGKSEHSFFLRWREADYTVPEGLQGDEGSLNYLREKYRLYRAEQHGMAFKAKLATCIEKTLEVTDYKITVKEDHARLHLLCEKKEGLPPDQLTSFKQSLAELAAVTETGIFPPFHFVDATTMVASTP